MAGDKRWNQSELDYLKSSYGIKDVNEIARYLNRSIDAVHWKASQFKIKFDPSNVVNINKRLDSIEKLLKELTDLMSLSINSTTAWTRKDTANLKRMYAEGLSVDEIAKKLERSKPTIYTRISQYGLLRGNRRALLSKEDKAFIENNYLTMRYSDIARQLSVARSTVQNYLHKQVSKGNLTRKTKIKT